MSARISTLHLSPRAIIYGCLANIGVSMAGGIVLTIAAFTTTADLTDLASLESTMQSTGILAAGLVLGLAAAILGGYVAARKSPRAELTNALAVGVVVTLLGILLQVLFRVPLDLWGALGFVTTIPAAAAGGLLRVSQLEGSAVTDERP